MNPLDLRKLIDRHRTRLSEIAVDCLGAFADPRPHDVISVGDHLVRIHGIGRPGAAERLAEVGLAELVSTGVATCDKAGFHRLSEKTLAEIRRNEPVIPKVSHAERVALARRDQVLNAIPFEPQRIQDRALWAAAGLKRTGVTRCANELVADRLALRLVEHEGSDRESIFYSRCQINGESAQRAPETAPGTPPKPISGK
jgi:hypothetical protein